MTLVFNIASQDPASALARSVSVNSPANKPVFTLGDNPLINLYVSDGAGGYDASSGAAGYYPWLGIGTPGALPSGGTFYLGVSSATSGTLTTGKRYLISTFAAGDNFSNVGGTNLTGNVFTASGTTPTTWTHSSVLIEITADIACPPTAATLQTALNATAAIGASGVTVTASTSSSLAFVVDWAAVGTRFLTTGYGSGMTPDSAAIVAQLVAGSATAKERQFLRLVANPAALQTAWSNITNGWQARLSCATRGLVDLLNGNKSQDSYLELEIVDSGGNVTTIGQVQCTIRNEVVDPAAIIPVPLPSYLTAAQTQLGFVGNQYSVTGLTGGGTNLDGLATGTTANPTIQTHVLVAVVVSGSASLYQLDTGTDATSSPTVIRPADYDGTLNARVWRLRAVVPSAHASTHASGGTDPVTLAESQITNLVSDLATLTSGVAARLPLAGGTITGQINFSGTTHAGIKLISLTTAQRNALTAANGMIIYNSTTGAVEKYASGAWTSIPNVSLTFYAENPVIGTAPTASGSDAVAVGYNATASGQYATAFTGCTASGVSSLAGGYSCTAGHDGAASFGWNSASRFHGHLTFSGNSNSQFGIVHTTFSTSNSTPSECLFGHNNDTRLALSNNQCFRYVASFTGRDQSSGDIGSWELRGVIRRGANAASTTLIYNQKDAEVNESGDWDLSASADTTNGALKFTITGDPSHTVKWNCTVHIYEIV